MSWGFFRPRNSSNLYPTRTPLANRPASRREPPLASYPPQPNRRAVRAEQQSPRKPRERFRNRQTLERNASQRNRHPSVLDRSDLTRSASAAISRAAAMSSTSGEVLGFIGEWYDAVPMLTRKFLIKIFVESNSIEIYHGAFCTTTVTVTPVGRPDAVRAALHAATPPPAACARQRPAAVAAPAHDSHRHHTCSWQRPQQVLPQEKPAPVRPLGTIRAIPYHTTGYHHTNQAVAASLPHRRRHHRRPPAQCERPTLPRR